MYKYITGIVLAFLSFTAKAQQQAAQVEMADRFREDGKIYVVIAVAGIILAGIFIYLFVLDRKVSSIEKQLEK